MKQEHFWGLIGVLFLAAAGIYSFSAHRPPSSGSAAGALSASAAASFLNGTYVIDGTPVTLVGGSASAPAAPGSASEVVTRYFGDNATGDLNGDGAPDIAFILTQTGGGSGTFYYVAAALKTADGYQGTNAVLLGDRIAPQTLEIRNGEIIANYAERKPGEPMSAAPSLGVSAYLTVSGTTLAAAH